MTNCDPGDVVLVRLPFTDLSAVKQRPAVILSPMVFTRRTGDVVVLAVTSQDQRDSSLSLRAWKEAGLLKPTWFKPILATLNAGIIVHRLGALQPVDSARISDVIAQMLDKSVLQRE